MFLIVSSCQSKLNMLGIIAGLWTAVALSIYTLYSKFVAQRYNTWAALAYGMLFFSVVIGGISPSISFSMVSHIILPCFYFILLFYHDHPYGLYLLGMCFLKPHQPVLPHTGTCCSYNFVRFIITRIAYTDKIIGACYHHFCYSAGIKTSTFKRKPKIRLQSSN